MQSWSIQTNGNYHDIVYEGLGATGKAKLSIDSAPAEVSPVFIKGQGYFFRYFVENVEIILHMERKNDPAQLAVDGLYYGSDQPVGSDILFTLRSQVNAGHPLGNKNRSGMGSFLSFVVFTYINIGLYVFSAPLMFPFSAQFPYLMLDLFHGVYFTHKEVLYYVIGIVLALVCATVYLVLYALAKRYTAPLVIALLLMVLDTLLVVWQLTIDPGYYIIDIVFHIWILGSLISVLRARSRMRRENLNVTELE